MTLLFFADVLIVSDWVPGTNSSSATSWKLSRSFQQHACLCGTACFSLSYKWLQSTRLPLIVLPTLVNSHAKFCLTVLAHSHQWEATVGNWPGKGNPTIHNIQAVLTEWLHTGLTVHSWIQQSNCQNIAHFFCWKNGSCNNASLPSPPSFYFPLPSPSSPSLPPFPLFSLLAHLSSSVQCRTAPHLIT